MGASVPEVGLGTLAWGRDTDEDVAAGQLADFVSAGGQVVDTSPYFGGGAAQYVLGHILAEKIDRADIHIVSRAGLAPHGPDASRSAILTGVRATLAELGTDWIDTLVLAEPDHTTDPEETADVLADLVHRGTVTSVGLGNCPGWYGGYVGTLLAQRGVKPAAFHMEYSLLNRGIEREIVPLAARTGAGIIAWSPLGRGVLTGRYRHSTPADSRAASPNFAAFIEPYMGSSSRQVVEAIATAADGLGTDIATVSLAWVLAQNHVTCAVIGPRTRAQLTSLLDSDLTEVPAAVTDALTEVTTPSFGYPERF